MDINTMKKTILFLLILFFSFALFSDEIGTRMWDASVRHKRPLGVLFTITGMATAPLLIPVAIHENIDDDDENIITGSLCGFGFGILWMLGSEFAGVVDIVTVGDLSNSGSRGDALDHIAEDLVKPAYCYYLDGIDNQIEDWQKAAEKRRNQKEYLREKKEREEKAAKEAEKKKQEEAKPEDKETHSWIKDN